MGTFSVVDASGKLRSIGIKGTTPTATEQQRIKSWLAQENAKVSVAKPAETAAPTGFFPAVESGFHGAVQSGYGALQGLGSLLDNQSLQDWAEEGAALEGKRAQEALPNPMTWENVNGVGDFFQFGAESIGQSVPYTAAAGLGALGGALAAPAAPVIAGVAGGAAATYPLLFGSNIERQKEASGEITSVGAAAAAAVPQALAESIVTRFTLGLGKFAGGVPTKVLTNKVTGVLSHVGASAGSESLQEVSQQVLERLQAGLPIDNEDAYREYANAAAAAAISGGVFGTIGSFGNGKQNNDTNAGNPEPILPDASAPEPISARFDGQTVPVNEGFTGNDDNDSVRNTLARIAGGELVPNKPVVRGTFGGQQWKSGNEERPVRASGQFGNTEFNRPPKANGFRSSAQFRGSASQTGESASTEEALKRWRQGDFVPPAPIQTGVFGTTPFATGERYVAPKPGIQFGDTEFNRPVRTATATKEEPKVEPPKPPKPSEFAPEKYQAAVEYVKTTGQADWAGLRRATGLNPKMAMRLRQEMADRGDVVEQGGKWVAPQAVTTPPVPAPPTTQFSVEPVTTKATGQEETAPAYAVVQKIVDESGNITSSAPIEVVKTEEEAKQALASVQSQQPTESVVPPQPTYPSKKPDETAGQYGVRMAQQGLSPTEVAQAIKENRPGPSEVDVLKAAAAGKKASETPGWRESFRDGYFDIETKTDKMTLTPEGKARLAELTSKSNKEDDLTIPAFLRRYEKDNSAATEGDYFLDVNRAEDRARLDKIGRDIDRKIGQYFPKNVGLNLKNYLGSSTAGFAARAQFVSGIDRNARTKRVIELAIGLIHAKMTDAEITARLSSSIDHEIIHALKDMGLFTEPEWQALVNYATKVPEVNAWVKNAKYSPDTVAEESVARLFQMWGQGEVKIAGLPRSLMQRIVDFFKKLAGFARAPDVQAIFDSIVSGEMNARPSIDEAGWADTNQMLQRGSNVDSPEFRAWFNGSQVVDNEGNPKVVYHYTRAQDFDAFNTAINDLGSHFGSPLQAKTIWGRGVGGKPSPAEKASGRTYPVYLSIKNPYRLEDKGAFHPFEVLPQLSEEFGEDQDFIDLEKNINGKSVSKDIKSIQKFLKKKGYDGVIYLNRGEGSFVDKPSTYDVQTLTDDEFQDKYRYAEDSWIAFYPTQIKSVANRGTFSSNDPDILHERNVAYERDNAAATQSPVLNSRNSNPSSRASATQVGKRVPATPDNLAQNITYTTVNDWVERRTARLPERVRPNKAKVQSVIEYLQDKMISLGALVDHVRKNDGAITDATDPYMKEELRSSASGDLIKAHEKSIYKDAIDTVNKIGFTDADLKALAASNPTASKFITSDTYKNTNLNVPMADLYLYAKAAPERNARLADETVGPMGSGMSDRDANQIKAWFERHPKFAGLVRAEGAVRQIIANTNMIREEGGLIPHGLEGEKFYVPMRGFLDEDIDPDESNDDWARTGQGVQVRWKEDRKPLGRGTLSSNIINRVILQNEEAIIRAGKAKVGQSFVRMILDNEKMLEGMADIIRVPPVKRVRIGGRVRLMVDPKYKDDPNVYTVKLSDDLAQRLGGERQAGDEISVRIHNDSLANAMKGGLVNEDSKRSLIRVMGKVNNFLTSVNTTFNPAFFLPNFFRDLITAGINIKQYEDIGGIDGLTPALMGNLRESFAAMRRFHRGGKSDKAIDRMREEMAKAGGFTEFYGLRTLEDTVRRTNNLISQDMSGGTQQALAQSKKAFNSLKGFIEDYNSVFENTTRLAVYKTLRDKGISADRAAQAAKNLTVNFNKAGAGKPLLNAMYLFYNAGIQGSWAIANAGLRSRKVRGAMVSIIAAGVAQDIMMGMMSPEDDDGKLVYDKIPDYQLEHNMIFLDPLGLSERGYFMIPLPYGFNAFFNAGRAAARMVRGGADIGTTLGSVAGATVGAFNPIGGTNSYLNFVAPTIADPFIDLARNRDFADRPIVPETSGFGVEKPASQLYWNNTSPLYTEPAKWLSQVSGGIGRIPGDVEVSPEVLQYWTEYMLGGVGSFVRQSFGVGLGGVQAAVEGAWPQIETNDVPMVRRLYGNISSRNDLEDYVVNRDKVMSVDSSIRTALETGDTATISEVIRRYPDEYKLSAAIRKIESMRTKIGGQIRDIEANPNIPSDKKRELIDVLKKRQDEIVGIGNKMMADLS